MKQIAVAGLVLTVLGLLFGLLTHCSSSKEYETTNKKLDEILRRSSEMDEDPVALLSELDAIKESLLKLDGADALLATRLSQIEEEITRNRLQKERRSKEEPPRLSDTDALGSREQMPHFEIEVKRSELDEVKKRWKKE